MRANESPFLYSLLLLLPLSKKNHLPSKHLIPLISLLSLKIAHPLFIFSKYPIISPFQNPLEIWHPLIFLSIIFSPLVFQKSISSPLSPPEDSLFKAFTLPLLKTPNLLSFQNSFFPCILFRH